MIKLNFLLPLLVGGPDMANKGTSVRMYTYKTKTTRNFNKIQKRSYSTNNGNSIKNPESKPNKSIMSRIWTGIKLGWNTPMLPKKVLSIHMHPFTRIFRVIGGISVIAFLSKKYLMLFYPLNIITLTIALAHLMYITIISIIKLFYSIKILRSKELEVRNSPLNNLATAAGKIIYCWKFGCQAGSAGLGLVGTSFLIDSMLEAGNQEKEFTPLIGKGVNFFVNGKPADELLLSIKKDTQNLENSKKVFDSVSSTLEKAENALNKEGLFSKAELEELRSAFKQAKDTEQNKVNGLASDLAKKIKEYSDNKNK